MHEKIPKINIDNKSNLVIEDIVLDISSIVSAVFHIILA